MYTSHGHHITGTPKEETPPEHVVRCGGPIICQECSRQASRATREQRETHTEDTLNKVYEALSENGIVGQQAIDAVSTMQNKGILFRERS